MAHFAKIENGIVVQVNVIDEQFFADNPDRYQGQWVQTSYNTHGGVHYNLETEEPSTDQSKALRKNFAGIGHTYDEARDAFIPPKPYPSWVLDEDTCLWKAPVPKPESIGNWEWNEETQQWED